MAEAEWTGELTEKVSGWPTQLRAQLKTGAWQLVGGDKNVYSEFGWCADRIVLELDGEVGAVLPRLHAKRFYPDVLDARNRRRHFFDSVDRFFLVGVAGVGIPLQRHEVQDGLGRAVLVLPGGVAGPEQRESCGQRQHSSKRRVRSHFVPPM